jgi:hypothetical protein
MIPAMIPLLLSLAGAAVPAVRALLESDAPLGGRLLDAAAGIASGLTGKADPAEAAAAIQADPALFARFQETLTQRALGLAAEETRRLAERERSWRAMTVSEDAYVRRARPTIIYALVAIGLAAAATAVLVCWREPVGDGRRAAVTPPLPHYRANTTVFRPLSMTRRSRCSLTARPSTRLSTSRPAATKSSAVRPWLTRSVSCSMIGPSSRSGVT